jgi:16S rRNA (guanine(966)-N(2))-methyltransferase RsmD
MRVTGGKFRGRRLKTATGLVSRPTTDKVRQSIFNILMNDISDKEVLDIFAGSGALGIEAVSRGAKKATFIEAGIKQVQVISDNLVSLDLPEDIIRSDFRSACRMLYDRKRQFGIIFADPPYEKFTPSDVAEAVIQYNLLSFKGFLIIEHKFGLTLENEGLVLIKQKKYGQTGVTIYVRK